MPENFLRFFKLTHLFWCVWALRQSQISTIPFDYSEYAKLRRARLLNVMSMVKRFLMVKKCECAVKPIAMRYLSTRGGAPELSFSEALLVGLAEDGIIVKLNIACFSSFIFYYIYPLVFIGSIKAYKIYFIFCIYSKLRSNTYDNKK